MSDGQILTVDRDFRGDLASAVRTASRSRRNSKSVAFRRVFVRIPRVDPLLWLASQNYEDRVFWSGRGHNDVVAGAGRVVAVEGHSARDFARMRREVGTASTAVCDSWSRRTPRRAGRTSLHTGSFFLALKSSR